MVEHVPFKLNSEFEPQGDQPQAIQKIVDGVNEGKRHQTLLGATGTGKTFTMSNVIKEVGKPTLIIAHNKTLAGQLYSEFKEFFPENRVEYFVVIMTIINQKHMYHQLTLSSKKTPQLTMKLTNYVTPLQVRYLSVMTSLCQRVVFTA